MKACQLTICASLAMICAHGAIFEFDIQPGGLTPASQPSGFSGAAGNEILPGISLNTASHSLSLNFAWGGINGFADLKAPFATAFLRGPVSTQGEVAPVLYDLTPYVTQQSPVAGGVFGYTLQLANLPSYSVAQQEADLLKARWYITVDSQRDAIVQIRGDLTPVPEPEHYAALAGLALAGFAVCRRIQALRA